jgi:hypothetical protein
LAIVMGMATFVLRRANKVEVLLMMAPPSGVEPSGKPSAVQSDRFVDGEGRWHGVDHA